MENKIRIGNRCVGEGFPPYFIAEIGANHNGDMELCRQMIASAKNAGADAVKFQSWSLESLISEEVFLSIEPEEAEQIRSTIRQYEFKPEDHYEIQNYCFEIGIEFLSTAFSAAEVDLLCELQVPAIKIASMDLNHDQLLAYVGSSGRPILLSTGMASEEEILHALGVLTNAGAKEVLLFHCVSQYPTPPEAASLKNIVRLREITGVPVGLSDHSLGNPVSLGGVALGANALERHYTLDKTMEGWDHQISLEPPEFQELVADGKRIFNALGASHRQVSAEELEKRKVFRRSLIYKTNKRQGDTLSSSDLVALRPGTGISPRSIETIAGRVLQKDVTKGRAVKLGDLV